MDEYKEISLSILKRFSKTLKYDIYVKRAEDSFTRIFNKGDSIDWDRVKLYLDKGLKYFYVTEIDYQLYTLMIERLGDVLAKSNKNLTVGESLEILKELVNYTMDEMVTKHNFNERVVESVGNLVSSSISHLSTSKKSFIKILGLLSSHPYLVKHSMSVSLFSVMLAKQVGINRDDTLEIVGLGGFLHDIGTAQLTFDPESKETLTAEERKELWRHPELGKQSLDGIKTIRTEVLMIVLQHHEQINGRGYPNNLKGGEIYILSRIIAIADTFSDLISKKEYREGHSTGAAIRIMQEDVGKYDKKFLKAFFNLFKPQK